MSGASDWSGKLHAAAERIRERYDHVGRNRAAPFLAVVYPPEAERAVLKEWRALAATLAPAFDVRTVDVLAVTSAAVRDIGVENVVDAMAEPMPGADPLAELGAQWTRVVAEAIRAGARRTSPARPVVVVERMAALYPASGPRAVMQALWDGDHGALDGPVVLLVPGALTDARVYDFVGKDDEFMYRGDIL